MIPPDKPNDKTYSEGRMTFTPEMLDGANARVEAHERMHAEKRRRLLEEVDERRRRAERN